MRPWEQQWFRKCFNLPLHPLSLFTVLLPDYLSPSMLHIAYGGGKDKCSPKMPMSLMSQCAYVALPGKGDLTDVNKLKIFRWEDYPGISGWTWCDQKGLIRRRQEVRGERSCCTAGFEDGGRGLEPKDVGSLWKLERQGSGFTLGSSRRKQPAYILIWAPQGSF